MIFLEVGQFVTTITLDHTLFTGLANPPQKPYVLTTGRPEPQILPPTSERPFVHLPPLPTTNNNDDKFEDSSDDFECGRTEYRAPTTTGLVIGGQAGLFTSILNVFVNFFTKISQHLVASFHGWLLIITILLEITQVSFVGGV